MEKFSESIRKLNLHRSNASPGIFSLSSSSSSKNRYLASLGKDRHIVIYDCHLQKVNCRTKKMMVSNTVVGRNNQVFLHVYTNTAAAAAAAAAASDVAADADTLKCIVADMNGTITLLSADNGVLNILSTISILDEKEDDNHTNIDTTTTDKECVVGMMVYPTNNHVLVTTNRGMVHVLHIPSTSTIATIVACFKGDQDTTTNTTSQVYKCMGLHPDGLILALGREVCCFYFVWLWKELSKSIQLDWVWYVLIVFYACSSYYYYVNPTVILLTFSIKY